MIICKLELEGPNITNLASLIKSVLVIKPGGKLTLIKFLGEKKKIYDLTKTKVHHLFFQHTVTRSDILRSKFTEGYGDVGVWGVTDLRQFF